METKLGKTTEDTQFVRLVNNTENEIKIYVNGELETIIQPGMFQIFYSRNSNCSFDIPIGDWTANAKILMEIK